MALTITTWNWGEDSFVKFSHLEKTPVKKEALRGLKVHLGGIQNKDDVIKTRELLESHLDKAEGPVIGELKTLLTECNLAIAELVDLDDKETGNIGKVTLEHAFI